MVDSSAALARGAARLGTILCARVRQRGRPPLRRRLARAAAASHVEDTHARRAHATPRGARASPDGEPPVPCARRDRSRSSLHSAASSASCSCSTSPGLCSSSPPPRSDASASRFSPGVRSSRPRSLLRESDRTKWRAKARSRKGSELLGALAPWRLGERHSSVRVSRPGREVVAPPGSAVARESEPRTATELRDRSAEISVSA